MNKKLIGVGAVLLVAFALFATIRTAIAQTSIGVTGTTTAVCPEGYICTTPVPVPQFTASASSSIMLGYDNGAESTLNGRFFITIDNATGPDLYVYKSGTVGHFVDSQGNTSQVRSRVNSSMNTATYLPTTYDEKGMPMYIIYTGKKANLSFDSAVGTRELFAGYYKATVPGILVNTTKNGSDASYVNLPKNESQSIAVVGEVSPYISSVSKQVVPNGKVEIKGQRLLSGGEFARVYIDGSEVGAVDGSKDGTTLFFTLPSGYDQGSYHTIHAKTDRGESNRVGFQVSQSAAVASIVGTPTLSLAYNLLGRESSVKATFDVLVNGGSTGVLIYSGYGTSILLTNTAGQQFYMSGTIISTSPTKTDFNGATYVAIAPGTSAQFRITGTANPQHIFAGTYKANLQNLYASVYDLPGEKFQFKLDVPATPTNAKTIVGETAPYITSTDPSGIFVPGQTVKVFGKRFISAKVKIDGVQQTGVGVVVNETGTVLRFTMPKLADGYHTLSLTKPIGDSNNISFRVGNVVTPVVCPAGYICTPGTPTTPQPVGCPTGYICTVPPPTSPLSTYMRAINRDGSTAEVTNLSIFDSAGKEVAIDTFNFPKLAPGSYSARYKTLRSGVETTITAGVDVTSSSYRIHSIKDSNGAWEEQFTLSIEGKYVKIVESRAGTASGTYLVEFNQGTLNIPPLTEAGIGPYINSNPGDYIMSIWERRDGVIRSEGAVALRVNQDRKGFDVREIDTTATCPAGYICTPGTPTTPQPVGCPVGYICTIPTPTPTVPPVSCYTANLTVNLTVGSTGSDVASLQTWLISRGFYIEGVSDGTSAKGYFGAATKAAVIKYQASVGIPADGFVGPITRASINGASCPITPVACPVGYTCTPGTPTTPQPVGCPKGYICTTLNNPPVISGGTFPSTLKVGETGTWKLVASDPEGGPLSYTVVWGDEPSTTMSAKSTSPSMYAVQSSTFTHIYNTAGNYTPVFYVSDNTGQSVKTSASVIVGTPVTAPVPTLGLVAVSTSYSTDAKERAEVRIAFKVTSLDGDIYIPKSPRYLAAGIKGNGTIVAQTFTSTSLSGDTTSSFSVRQGTSRSFTYSAVVDNSSGSAGYSNLIIGQVEFGMAALAPTGHRITQGLSSLMSGSFYLGGLSSTPSPSYTPTPTPSPTPASFVGVSIASPKGYLVPTAGQASDIMWNVNWGSVMPKYPTFNLYEASDDGKGYIATNVAATLAGCKDGNICTYYYRWTPKKAYQRFQVTVTSPYAAGQGTSAWFSVALSPTPIPTPYYSSTPTPIPTPTYSASPSYAPSYEASPSSSPDESIYYSPSESPSESPVTLRPMQNATIWDALMQALGF
jgi:peptidoglycan hydrolase-like protein with peptidoglycan-binding domain